MARNYTAIREELVGIEEIIAGGEGLSERDLKRLDKGVVLMKVGAKLIKRVLRAHGARGRLKGPYRPNIDIEPSTRPRANVR